jgi:hypothetical protein
MKVEIVEFYPAEKQAPNVLRGSLHVYIIDLKMDLRGVLVLKIKNKWNFFLPRHSAIDSETKNKVFYPIINFTDSKKNKELRDSIRYEGKKYIEKMMQR